MAGRRPGHPRLPFVAAKNADAQHKSLSFEALERAHAG
jgi:hypothetical protein